MPVAQVVRHGAGGVAGEDGLCTWFEGDGAVEGGCEGEGCVGLVIVMIVVAILVRRCEVGVDDGAVLRRKVHFS